MVRGRLIVEHGDHPIRLMREARLKELVNRTNRAFIAPPYHLRNAEMIYLLCRFDADSARACLPRSLECEDAPMGVVGFAVAEGGWGFAPFGAFYMSIQVKGHDGPDGYPANFVHTSYYSGPAGQLMPELYNANAEKGWVRVTREGNQLSAEAGLVEGIPHIHVRARRTDRVGPEVTGANHYIGELRGAVTTWSTTYISTFRDLEDVEIEILDSANERMRALTPLEVAWPLSLDEMSLTFGPPRPLTDPKELVLDVFRATVFAILGRINKASVIVTRSGRVSYMNAEAQSLLATSGVEADALPYFANRELQKAMRAVESGAEVLSETPLALSGPHGGLLLARVMALPRDLSGEPSVLIMFSDPTADGWTDPSLLLELLGLTPAEARLAKLVGQGHGVERAASMLSITYATAHTTLKLVYDKLEVNKQSQLAQIVTRLESL
jgi:DNA-binding CsgD family transcriptional regulator